MLQKVFSRLINVLQKANRWLVLAGGIVCLMLTAVVTYIVFTRYVLHAPSEVLPELASYMMIIIVFLGTAYTLWVDGHVRVEILVSRLRPRPQNIMSLITHTLALVFIGIATWKTAQLARAAYVFDWHSPSGLIPLFPFQLFMPIGGTLLFLTCCYKVYLYYKAAKAK